MVRYASIAVLVFSGIQDLVIAVLALFSPATLAPIFQITITEDARFLSSLLGELLAFFSALLLYSAYLLWKRHPHGAHIAAFAGLMWIGAGITLYGFRGAWPFLIGDSLRGLLVFIAALSRRAV